MRIKDLGGGIDKVVKDTLLEYIQKIYQDAMSGLKGASSVKSTFQVSVSDGGYTVTLFSDEEMAAYIEFGTGNFAATYLAGKPKEMVEDALKFFVNGKGTMPAKPYLFPAFYKYRDEIVKVMDKRIQKLFDSATI